MECWATTALSERSYGLITYHHVRQPAGHKVKLAPPSPHTTARYCDVCHGEVLRNRPGEREVIVDPLFPAGTRPTCYRCKEHPVYMAGLCGTCYRDTGRAAVQ